jgi:hydroxymethylpyrimidine/phosphomethylpyrimidine kinase
MNNKKRNFETSNLKRQTSNVKPVLLISASDSSCAAGMQVDLRVVNDLGHAARCAITAVTVQGDVGLVSIYSVDPDNVAESIAAAYSDPADIGAVKIGLITTPEVVRAVSQSLIPIHRQGVPVVLDPVMRSTPGSTLASSEVIKVLVRDLLPVTTVLTPNREELKELALIAGTEHGEEPERAEALISMGTAAVLVTGGDDGGRTCVDALYRKREPVRTFEHPRIGEGSTRGTGCALSAALAVNLGKSLALEEAVNTSINYITDRISKAVVVGSQRLLFPGKIFV